MHPQAAEAVEVTVITVLIPSMATTDLQRRTHAEQLVTTDLPVGLTRMTMMALTTAIAATGVRNEADQWTAQGMSDE